MAYFDYNATTPLNHAARSALVDALDTHWSNPSSPYRQSARVHTVLESAREALATQLNIPIDQLIFTGGATEANNSVIRYFADQLPPGKTVAFSPFEHPSVSEAIAHMLPESLRLRVENTGEVNVTQLSEEIQGGGLAAVSVMAVNNETGVIQPWQQIAQLCREFGILFHCDASQWFGKRPDGDFGNCDFLVGCGHKFGGPKGIAFLALSQNGLGMCAQYGGGQEFGMRGGTENVPAILAMVAALKQATEELPYMEEQRVYRDGFESTLESKIPNIEFIGSSAQRVPNTSFVLPPRFVNTRWVSKLDKLGFQVSTGSACATGKASVSPVLDALGYPPDAGERTIRVSSGPTATASDWENLTGAFLHVWSELRETDAASGTEVISV